MEENIDIQEVRKSVREHRQATHKKQLARYMRCQDRRGLKGPSTLDEFLQTTEVKTESGKSTGFTYSPILESAPTHNCTGSKSCLGCERDRRNAYASGGNYY